MKISAKRRQAIYDAVYVPLMQLRFAVVRQAPTGFQLDELIRVAQYAAADGAVDAATAVTPIKPKRRPSKRAKGRKS